MTFCYPTDRLKKQLFSSLVFEVHDYLENMISMPDPNLNKFTRKKSIIHAERSRPIKRNSRASSGEEVGSKRPKLAWDNPSPPKIVSPKVIAISQNPTMLSTIPEVPVNLNQDVDLKIELVESDGDDNAKNDTECLEVLSDTDPEHSCPNSSVFRYGDQTIETRTTD